MHPFHVATDLQKYGFWYTYWSLRNNNCYTRPQSLWLIWVGHQHNKYMDKRLNNSVRILTK
jgi:hypothetical protein